MATEFKLPELGEGIDSGDVLEIFVSEGDTIAKNQPILELETDKASVEVPSKVEGTITKIHVAKGQTVAIGAVVLTVEGGAAAAPPAATAESAPETPPTPTPPPVETPPQAAPVASESRPAPAAPAPVPPAPAPAEQPTAPPVAPAVEKPAATPVHSVSSGASAPAGPAIRRLAREVGVDITTVQGTGAEGRITRDDILSVVRGNGAKESAATTAPAATPAAPATPAPASPSPGTSESVPTADANADSDEWGAIHIEPMTRIRKTISSKMHESWATVPRVTNFDDADVTELEDIRQASKKDYLARGIKLTQMPFLIKAVAMSLKTNPTINAAIDEQNSQIIYKKYVNVGIAVDTDRGLVVPSLRSADQHSIPEIARALGKIGENARSSSFSLEDLRGSTFTISNLGAIGGQYSTPIINVPEVAILLVGRSRKMPVVVNDEVVVRLMMPLSLSYDHRLVDGATAARFLNDVISYMQSPSRLLIAP